LNSLYDRGIGFGESEESTAFEETMSARKVLVEETAVRMLVLVDEASNEDLTLDESEPI